MDSNGQSVLIKLKKDLGQGEKVQVGLEVYNFCRKTFPNLFPSQQRYGHTPGRRAGSYERVRPSPIVLP